MRYLKYTGLLLIITLSSTVCLSWGFLGHRTVADIAMYIINSKIHDKIVVDRIQKVLNSDEDGRALGSHIGIQQVATFADDMRDNPDFDCIKNLHFSQIPLDATNYKDYANSNPNGDLVSGIVTLIDYIHSGDPKTLSSTKSLEILNQNPKTRMTKELALKLLVHFIGDLYQPLHLGSAEDWGGNKIEVVVFNSPTNLHSALDGILKEPLDARDFADDNKNEITNAEFSETWKIALYQAADETIALRKQLYNFPDGMKTVAQPKDDKGVEQPPKEIPIIGYKYILDNKAMLRTQIQKGGIMLARVMIQLFDPIFKQRAKFGFYKVQAGAYCQQVML